KPADATRCAECGADVSRPKAVRIGRRQRRPRLLAMSLLLLILSLAGLGVHIWATARHIEWIHYEPANWLIRRAERTAAGERDAALSELMRRIKTNELSDADLHRLTDNGLAHQADPDPAWGQSWIDVIETAHGTKRLAHEQWRRYVDQGVQNALRDSE